MTIKLGEKILRDIYLGDKRIVKAYFGEKLVFEADKPIFVDYIESTGTQYIDLGYISPERAKTLRFVADMSIDTTSGYRLCGSGYFNKQLYFGFSSSNTFAYGPGNVDAAVGVYVKTGVKYHYDYDVLNGSYKVLENGTIVASKQFEFSGYIGGNFYLFCYAGRDEVPTVLWSGKIYSFLVYENNTLIQHLKPCIHPKTFEACMYDTVSHKYFYNKGTGNFIPAPRFVEYLESDGNQWIDTQYIISSENIKLNIKANIPTLENMKTLCGSQIDGYSGFGGLIYYNSSYGGLGVCVGTNYNNNTYSPITAGIDYEIEHTANNGVATLTKNGVENTTTYTGTLISNNTWYLFWSNGGTSAYKIKAKIYYARLEDNGVVVRDLRPCLDYNNVPCMYDMVTGKYFYNQGTGEFKYGGLV